MVQMGKILSWLPSVLMSRWVAKVGVVFAVGLLVLIIAGTPAQARVKFSDQTPAQGTIVHDLQPTISFRIEATGDTEVLDGNYNMSITGSLICAAQEYRQIFGYGGDPGFSVSVVKRDIAKDPKVITGSVDLRLIGCTLSQGRTVTVQVHAEGSDLATIPLFGGSVPIWTNDSWTFLAFIPASGSQVITITVLNPSSGPPGTVVTLTCHGCQQGNLKRPGSAISFDGTPASTTFLSDAQPQFTVPSDAICGPHTVQVINTNLTTNLNEVSNVVSFTVTEPCITPNQPPSANFSFDPSNPNKGQQVKFTDTSTDPDGASDIVSWSWDFGDGNSSTKQNPKHTYNNAGTFTVKLTVTDSVGQTSIVNKSVTVKGFSVGFAPPPPPPPSGGGSSTLKSFDTNNNNMIDDPEFFAIIDTWIASQVDDQTFFQGIDLWISQGAISSAGLSSRPFDLDAVILMANSTQQKLSFIAHGQGISAIGVEIFDLNGTKIFTQETTGAQLTWNLNTPDGQPVANGVYLYMVTIRGIDGRALKNDLKKLAVLR